MASSIAVLCADISVRNGRRCRHMAARRHPLLVGFELDPEPVVENPQIAVGAANNRVWHHRLHLLGDHADISPVASVISEAIEADAIRKMTKKNKIVLERDVRTASATAAAATATTAAPSSAAAHTGTAAAATHAGATTPAKACMAARRLCSRHIAALDISKPVAARRPLPGTR